MSAARTNNNNITSFHFIFFIFCIFFHGYAWSSSDVTLDDIDLYKAIDDFSNIFNEESYQYVEPFYDNDCLDVHNYLTSIFDQDETQIDSNLDQTQHLDPICDFDQFTSQNDETSQATSQLTTTSCDEPVVNHNRPQKRSLYFEDLPTYAQSAIIDQILQTIQEYGFKYDEPRPITHAKILAAALGGTEEYYENELKRSRTKRYMKPKSTSPKEIKRRISNKKYKKLYENSLVFTFNATADTVR